MCCTIREKPKDCPRLAADLGEALEGNIAVGRLREELEEDLNDVGLKNVAQGHPGEVGVQGGERGADQVRALARAQHKEAELMDEAKLGVERVFELLGLCLHKMAGFSC